MKKNIKKILLIIILLFIFFITLKALINKVDQTMGDEGISSHFAGNIAISRDDKKIAYSYHEDREGSAIFTSNIDGSGSVKLTQPAENEYHRVQGFSSDGSKILYLSYKKNLETPTSYLYEIDVISGNKKQITIADQHITEAIYGSGDKKIYFIKSGFFGSYASPQAYPHDFDIYSINVDGSSEKKLTKLKNYESLSLSLNNSGTKLYFKGVNKDNKDVFYELDTETLQLKDFIPINIKLSTSNTPLYDPQISKSGAFVFTTPDPDVSGSFAYELFGMNIQNSSSENFNFSLPATQITKLRSCVSKPRFFNHSNELLLVQDINCRTDAWRSPSYQLLRVNLDDFSTVKIPLEGQNSLK